MIRQVCCKTGWLIVVSLALASVTSQNAYARPAVMRMQHTPHMYRYFEIGVRSYHYNLRDTRRRGDTGYDNANWYGNINFIGSIWGLDEIQNYLPRLYVQVALTPYAGIGVSYDTIGAKTVDWGNAERTRTATDGSLHLHGGLLYAFLRYPLYFGLQPFCEIGGAWYRSQFTEAATWKATGDGYRMKVDHTKGYFVALGVNVALTDDWALSVYWRRMMDLDVKARAYFDPGPDPNRVGSFPMEYTMFGIGASYVF